MNDDQITVEQVLERVEYLEENADTIEEAMEAGDIYCSGYREFWQRFDNGEKISEDELITNDKLVSRAIEWYKKAYNWGNKEAVTNIIVCYYMQARTYKLSSAEEAIKWCMIAKKLPIKNRELVDSILADSQELKKELLEHCNSKAKGDSKQNEEKGQKSIWFLLVGILFVYVCFSQQSLGSGILGAILILIYFKG